MKTQRQKLETGGLTSMSRFCNRTYCRPEARKLETTFSRFLTAWVPHEAQLLPIRPNTLEDRSETPASCWQYTVAGALGLTAEESGLISWGVKSCGRVIRCVSHGLQLRWRDSVADSLASAFWGPDFLIFEGYQLPQWVSSSILLFWDLSLEALPRACSSSPSNNFANT